LASSVHRELRGLGHYHKNYRKLKWKTVVMPAVNIAHYGFRVLVDTVKHMESAKAGSYNFLAYEPSWASDFTLNGIVRLPNGTFQAAGEPRQAASRGIAF
jgi:gamma-glutamyltranspeptidase / glutathione hydrolase